MDEVIAVTEVADSRVERFALRRETAFKPQNEMVIDSEKVVRRAIKRGVRLRAVLATESHYRRNWDLLQTQADCAFYLASTSMMMQIVGHRIHQGIMAVAERMPSTPLAEMNGPLVLLENVTDTQNVGAIVRCCHAFGYGGLVLDETCCSPFVRRSIRVSMGSVFCIPTFHGRSSIAIAEELKSRGYVLLAAGRWPGSLPMRQVRIDRPYALIIGNEDQGISEGLRGLCDATVEIQLAPGIDSLNAAVAAGVLLHGLRERYAEVQY